MKENCFLTFGVCMAFQSGFEKKDECPIRMGGLLLSFGDLFCFLWAITLKINKKPLGDKVGVSEGTSFFVE
jgi:hypothetical protein